MIIDKELYKKIVFNKRYDKVNLVLTPAAREAIYEAAQAIARDYGTDLAPVAALVSEIYSRLIELHMKLHPEKDLRSL